MAENSKTWSRPAQLMAGVALVTCLVGSLGASPVGAAPGGWVPASALHRHADDRGPREAGTAAHPAVQRKGWATLPPGLRMALARLHPGLGPAARASQRLRWAPGARGRSQTALHPHCQCGGGGGTTWNEQAELGAADGANGDWFGASVVLSGDGSRALIGAPFANNSKGAVYIFNLSGGTWSQTAELTAADGAGGDDFGGSVALGSDNTVLIGALGKNSSSGATYVFVPQFGGWVQQAELTDPKSVSVDMFGVSVALSSNGNTALIGAEGVNNVGAAYVYARNGSTWSQTADLTAADSLTFGTAVALSSDGSTALIGASVTAVTAHGAAYVFALSGTTWSQQAELTASDGANGDSFGSSVALGSNGSAGPVALIGAPNKNNYTGAAYVFAPFFGWNQQAELTASDGTAFDSFGTSVALSSNGSAGPVALIGAYYKNTGTGAAYVYQDQGSFGPWALAQELTATDGAIGNSFGWSVALNGDGSTMLIGAKAANSFTGAAYIFSTDAPPTATPTNTPVPPTNTPTNTPVPPTSTPTNTPVPWHAQPSGTTSTLRGVACPTSISCATAGDSGVILYTHDGTTWHPWTSGTTSSLNAIACPAYGVCFVVGANGLIRATTGAGWSAQASGTTHTLRGIACSNTSDCAAAGDNGVILYTHNGGATWKPWTSGTTTGLNAITCPAFGVCYVVGNNGLILASTGAGWHVQSSGTTHTLRGIACATTSACVAVGDSGVTRYTVNSGATWSGLASGTTSALNAVACSSAGVCDAVGNGGAIIALASGVWHAQPSGTTANLHGVACPSGTICYAVGDTGTVLRHG